MDEDVSINKRSVNVSLDNDSRSAVNSVILDYYQKFGRKRDLEQFFSLSTAQNDIRDPTSLFWRKMKACDDSSDSGERRSEASTELCRISIKCTLPETLTLQDDHSNSKDESESPPIITEEPALPQKTEHESPNHTDNESLKSDDNNSQKSTDAHLDLSINKPLSPTSSITSQRKLEWDSLGDVGYGNESERKASGSSLSTLERLALHQQLSNNDNNTQFGAPTSHSTPVDPNNSSKGKKGNFKKKTNIHKKDIDVVELNIPYGSEKNSAGINFNLTKHISFNVDKDGDITIANSKDTTQLFPNKVSVETEMTPNLRIDKEIQTSLINNEADKDKLKTPVVIKDDKEVCEQKFPILISLNTLRKRVRKKKFRTFKKKVCNKGKKKNITSNNKLPEKSGSQISEAESFEYMPGHVYNQKQVQNNNMKDLNSVGNKSSLESSVVFTTDSSKISKNSFTNDLEKSIDLLKTALHPKYNNSILKEKLIKEVVQRLLTTRYRDDDSASAFLSGLNFNSERLGISDSVPTTTTTSASEGNNIGNSNMIKIPKKSILRMDKFNPSGMASTSQSTPNLHTIVQNENLVNVLKTSGLSNTESDISGKERNSSDTITKLSSEELYKKYLEALKREKVHKQLLKDKEALLRSKLVSSDSCIKTVPETCDKSRERLYKLIKDLASNKVDDGSGDAYKFEEDSSSNINKKKSNYIRKQKSHSVFTLASGKSICNTKLAKHNIYQNPRQNTEGESSHTNGNCCCHSNHNTNSKIESFVHKSENHKEDTKSQKDCHFYCKRDPKTDMPSSKQHVISNKSSPRRVEDVANENTQDVQYVCLCSNDAIQAGEVPDKLLIYKCSRVSKQGACVADTMSKESTSIGVQCSYECSCTKQIKDIKSPVTVLPDRMICVNRELQLAHSSSSFIYPTKKASTSSQTSANLDLILRRDNCARSATSIASNERYKPEIISTVKIDDEIDDIQSDNVASQLFKEVTRSIQTEISIDPKISDPTLSDVIFLNDLDFVSGQEKYRHASSTCSSKMLVDENTRKKRLKCNGSLTSTRVNEVKTNIENECDLLNEIKCSKARTQSGVHVNENDLRDPKLNRDKFSIPIQGTNMTLVVSLGSKTADGKDELRKNVDVNTKGLINNERLQKDRDMHFEGYLKGVQCNSTDIFTPINNENKQVHGREGETIPINTGSLYNNHGAIIVNETRMANSYVTESSLKYNTYPKTLQSAKKPFVRSNTDTNGLGDIRKNIDKHVKINVETQKDFCSDVLPKTKDVGEFTKDCQPAPKNNFKNENVDTSCGQYNLNKSSACSRSGAEDEVCNDPILNIIQGITKRYTKKDMEKSKRKKCFKEIISVLNYLLDTEECADGKEELRSSCNPDRAATGNEYHEKDDPECSNKKTYVDKGVQLVTKNKKQKTCTESSDIPTSSEMPTTSTDTTTCKVLNKIRRECEKYHQKRCCKSGHKNCDESSSTTVNCQKCNRQHQCACRSKCKVHKTKSGGEKDKVKKKCVAYNLIIQTSDSIASEETVRGEECRPLQDVIVKVPPKNKHLTNAPFREVSAKIEKKLPHFSPGRDGKVYRCRSLPNDSEMSSEDFGKKMRTCTVRDYLEMNRPDFIDRSAKRQTCMQFINQTRTNERATKRKLLSQQMGRQQALNALSSAEVQQLARELAGQLRRKNVGSKFISEHEMKKHSEKIYKSLPEVVKKKEELKKENAKKTNLLMANIFKKNLQKKTLCGSVNLSNYSTVLKI